MARGLYLKQDWKDVMANNIASHQPINYSSAEKLPIRWLILELLKAKRPYKVSNLGVGVTNITTDTDICPQCKRKL